MEKKICRTCQVEKSVEEFFKSRRMRGIQLYSLDCIVCASKTYMDNMNNHNPDMRRLKPTLKQKTQIERASYITQQLRDE